MARASDLDPWPSGQADCPCIDPWAHLHADGIAGIELNEHTPPSGAGPDCAFTRAGDRLCYSTAYGSAQCAAHDAALNAGDAAAVLAQGRNL